MQTVRSQELFEEAKRYIPGGVNSPVRAFRAVGGQPLFIQRGAGARLYDVDGNEFIDHVSSWGPLILGHNHPVVAKAIKEAVDNGTSFGAPTELEVTMAKLVTSAMPAVEVVRFVNSGTEATMSALRLARAFTGRDKILKMEGCYHGHADGLLAKAGSGAMTFGLPDSPGVPAGSVQGTITAPYNDLDAVREIFARSGKEIAAVILEPVAGNMGVVPPKPGYLAGLRELTSAAGILLIFDEVISGFRVGYRGAQGLYGIKPDLTTLGKIIGGGLPVGAYGGRRDIMAMVAPAGPVYQAGTLSGNPLAMTAGIATLSVLAQSGVYEELERKGKRLADGLKEAARDAHIPLYATRVGSMMTAFFTDQEVVDYASAKTADTARYARYFQRMLEHGVYFAPSQFEAGFVSTAHSDADIDQTIAAAKKVMKELAA